MSRGSSGDQGGAGYVRACVCACVCACVMCVCDVCDVCDVFVHGMYVCV